MKTTAKIEVQEHEGRWLLRITDQRGFEEVWGRYADQFNAVLMLPEAAKRLQELSKFNQGAELAKA